MAEETLVQQPPGQPSLAILAESWRSLGACSNPDESMTRLLATLSAVTHATYVCLMLLDEEQNLVLTAAVGVPLDLPAPQQVKIGEGIAGWVAQTRCPLRLPISADSFPNALNEGGASVLCVPLVAAGHMMGILTALQPTGQAPFTPQDLDFASLMAERTALAVHTAHLESQLASRDLLMGRILESVPSSLVVIDRSLRIVSANRNFLEKNRRDAQSTLGRKIEDVFPHVLVEYTRLDQKVRDIFRIGQPFEGGKVSYRAPGLPSRVYFYRLVPLKAGEAVEHVMLLMDDITEREQLGEEVRRAERHLASVVECANDLVTSIDLQGGIVTWNPAAERTSGLKAEDVKARSLLSLCAVEERPVMAEMLEGLKRGERVHNTEVNLLTASSQQVPIAWSCSPMLDDTGHVAGIVAVGRDLTERRRLELQLIQSAKMASLGGMAGGIAHELRNPLGIISISAQLLQECPNDADLRNEYAEKIYRATQRASLIIENLLKFACPPGKRMRDANLHAILEDTFILLAHQISLQKVQLTTSFQPDLPSIYANPELLQQVFTNLILNACNAMPNGGSLAVSTRAVSSG